MSKQRWFRAIAVALGTCAGLLLGEIALRVQSAVSGHGLADADLTRAPTLVAPPFDGTCEGRLGASLAALMIPSAHPGVVHELKRGLDTCFVRVRVRTGADGLRTGVSEPDAPPAPPPALRILLLGDSQAFGW